MYSNNSIIKVVYEAQFWMAVISLKSYPCFSFSKSVLTALLQTAAVFGPIFGYVLGSLFIKLYVDFGLVNTGTYFVHFIVL